MDNDSLAHIKWRCKDHNILVLAFAFYVAIIIGITITSLGMKMNFFNSANYSEDLDRRAKPILQSTEKITEDMIPNGCKFAVFDKEFKVIKTDLTGEDLKEATLYAKGIDRKSGDKKTYYFIERKDGFCVLQYYIKMRYSLEWMNEYLPNPELLLIIILILGCLIGAFIISIVFARNLKNNLIPLIEATEKIKEQDLEKRNVQKFVYDIYNQLIALAGPKKLQVKFEEKDLPENIIINKEAMHRAIINVISNAVEYSPFNSNLYFSVEGKDNYLEFSVIDSGKGFSSRDLKVAKKQFYMSDSSRTSKIHWGMGFYIADFIVKQHNGTLIIKNS